MYFRYIDPKLYKLLFMDIIMETVTISKQEFEQMKTELETLRNSKLYRKLLKFQDDVVKGKKYTRKELGI